jgi:hypothetical protein
MMNVPGLPLRGFFLGLSSGTVCLFSCAPVLVPYLLGEGRRTGGNFLSLGLYLAGRLAGYLVFGAVAWEAGRTLGKFFPGGELFFGAVLVVLSLLLVAYGILSFRTPCAGGAAVGSPALKSVRSGGVLFPVLLGFLTGLNLCPPFLAALADSSGAATLSGSLAFFLMFFLGTAVFFLPVPFLGVLSRFPQAAMVGRMTAVLMGAWYFHLGIMKCIGGMTIQ